MNAAPGSIGWLLRHETRLLWYGAGPAKPGKSDKPQRRPGTRTLVAAALAWLALHVLAYYVVGRSSHIDVADPLVLATATALLVGGMTFMLSSALKSSVVVLFERGDLDLLLSSPLSSRSIFTVRLGTVAAGTAAMYLFFLAPFAHAGALMGHLAWLAVYPVMLGSATLIACAAMLATLGLVRVLGARRTRVVAQVIGALAGAALFILAQLANYFSSSLQAQAETALARALASDGILGAGSPLWLPGRALLGEPVPAIGIVIAAVTAFAFTVGKTHRFFVLGLQQAASARTARRAPRRSAPIRFGRGLFLTVLLKEWRLVVRDPHLISQVALQLIYLLPLSLAVFSKSDARLPLLAAGLTLLCSSLSASLAWIIVAAEDAPDLLAMAPAPPRVIQAAKLSAAMLPSLAIALPPLAWLGLRLPSMTLLAALVVAGAVCAAAIIAHWCAKPGLRSDFVARGRSDYLTSILQMFNSLSWGALAWIAVSAPDAPSSFEKAAATIAPMAAGLTLLLAWLLRRQRD
jgi:ABC-2 type transport system permease protein